MLWRGEALSLSLLFVNPVSCPPWHAVRTCGGACGPLRGPSEGRTNSELLVGSMAVLGFAVSGLRTKTSVFSLSSVARISAHEARWLKCVRAAALPCGMLCPSRTGDLGRGLQPSPAAVLNRLGAPSHRHSISGQLFPWAYQVIKGLGVP